jgi:hypothetical protein
VSYELIDAMSMRDGGSTYVSLRAPTRRTVTYWFDYSLPWDGRARQIREVQGEESRVLQVGTPEELAACQQVRSVLIAQFGNAAVSQFEAGAGENPGKGPWFYAFNFLRLCVKEGKLNE